MCNPASRYNILSAPHTGIFYSRVPCFDRFISCDAAGNSGNKVFAPISLSHCLQKNIFITRLRPGLSEMKPLCM
jgi:hypothetical protein